MSSRRFLPLLLCFSLMFLAACTGDASKMAAEQPRAHDMSVLKIGTERARVVAEFGKPLLTEDRNGTTVDLFKFIDGYSKGARASRSFFHGAFNVVTFGAWDLVGKPMEGAMDGKDVQVEVEYDKDRRVSRVRRFDNK